MKKHISTTFSVTILVALTNLTLAVEESDFGFGDNVGEIQFNDDPIVAVVNQFSRSGSSSSCIEQPIHRRVRCPVSAQ